MNLETFTNTPHYANLVKFVEGVNQKIEDYWNRNNFTFAKPDKVMVHSIGGRYAKLAVHRERDGKYEAESVYCFFDFDNGDLLKGTWKAPVAKGVRGNVNEPDVLNKFTEHGPAYLR